MSVCSRGSGDFFQITDSTAPGRSGAKSGGDIYAQSSEQSAQIHGSDALPSVLRADERSVCQETENEVIEVFNEQK